MNYPGSGAITLRRSLQGGRVAENSINEPGNKPGNKPGDPAGDPRVELHDSMTHGVPPLAGEMSDPAPVAAGTAPAFHPLASSSAGAEDEQPEEPEEPDEADSDDGVEYVEERVVVMRRGVFAAFAGIGAALLIGLAAFGAYEVLKPPPSVATVNSSSISRADYDKAVAGANGQQVLDDLIQQRLIDSDAARKKVSISTDDVDAKLKEITKQFPTDAAYRQALDSQQLTEVELRARVRRSLLLQKLVGDKGQATDAEVQQAYDQGKDTQYQGKTFDEVKDDIRTQLNQAKQQDAATGYLDDLKKNAKITQHLPGKGRS
jgi:hypothetical protein